MVLCAPSPHTTSPHTFTNSLPHTRIPHLRRKFCSLGCGRSGHRWLGSDGHKEFKLHLLQLLLSLSGLERALARPPLRQRRAGSNFPASRGTSWVHIIHNPSPPVLRESLSEILCPVQIHSALSQKDKELILT